MSQIKFSIAIATYNRLSLLGRAIDTALAQTLTCEVIVVDDCSSDGTEAYVRHRCAEMQIRGDERLIYHRNSTNLGHSETVNTGVQLASGEWIKLLDDDDYLAVNCIEEMSQAIALHPAAAICSCQAIQVDVHQLEVSKTKRIGPGKAFYIPQADIHYGMLLEQVPFGTPVQVAFRRDAFLKSGGWDSSLDTNFDDIDSWIKIAQFGDAIFINSYLSYRTIWPGAYNQKLSLERRRDTNIAIKEKIYVLVNEKYQDRLPSWEDIQAYLKLHWSLVAGKQGKFRQVIAFAFPAVFSLGAWKLLAIAVGSRQATKKKSSVPKLVLISE